MSHTSVAPGTANDVVRSDIVSCVIGEHTTPCSIDSNGAWGIWIQAKAEFFASRQGFERALKLFEFGSADERRVYELEFAYYCERQDMHAEEATNVFKDLLYQEYTSTIRSYQVFVREVSPRAADRVHKRAVNGDRSESITLPGDDDCTRWLEQADRGSVLLEIIPLVGADVQARVWGVFIPHST
jgi:hypothetical protein